MEENKEKLSYEELEKEVIECKQRYSIVVNRLKQAEAALMQVERLNYILRVIEFKSIFPEDFIKSCVNEVVQALAERPNEDKKEE